MEIEARMMKIGNWNVRDLSAIAMAVFVTATALVGTAAASPAVPQGSDAPVTSNDVTVASSDVTSMGECHDIIVYGVVIGTFCEPDVTTSGLGGGGAPSSPPTGSCDCTYGGV